MGNKQQGGQVSVNKNKKSSGGGNNGALHGTGDNVTSNPVINTAQNLKQTITRLEKRREFVQKKIDQELQKAKEKAKSNKQAALIHIKKKKFFEKDVLKLDGMIFNLEQQMLAVESGSVNYDVVKAMREGLNAQKKMNQNMDVDNTAELVDEIREQQDELNEVNELLGTPLEDFANDAELLKELEEIGAEELEKEVTKLPKAKTQAQGQKQEATKIELPDAPKNKVDVPTEQVAERVAVVEGYDSDEEALRALQAEMD